MPKTLTTGLMVIRAYYPGHDNLSPDKSQTYNPSLIKFEPRTG